MLPPLSPNPLHATRCGGDGVGLSVVLYFLHFLPFLYITPSMYLFLVYSYFKYNLYKLNSVYSRLFKLLFVIHFSYTINWAYSLSTILFFCTFINSSKVHYFVTFKTSYIIPRNSTFLKMNNKLICVKVFFISYWTTNMKCIHFY